MDITMEQSVAAAVRYIQDNMEDGTKLYFDEIPEQFYVPSIYFRTPDTKAGQATLSTYKVTYTMYIWFLEHLDWDAQAKASAMRDNILLDSCLLPVMDNSGQETGKWVRVKSPETRKIDEGIAQLSFSFDVYFQPGEQKTKIQNFYTAWKNDGQGTEV